MSRPRYWWYGSVKKAIMQSHKLKQECFEESIKYTEAINQAMQETRELDNGELRVKAINNILIKQTETIESQSIKIYYSEDTVKRWVSDFVNLVGKHKGYI